MSDKFINLVLDCSGSMSGWLPRLNPAMTSFLKEMQADRENDYTIRLARFGYVRPGESWYSEGYDPVDIIVGTPHSIEHDFFCVATGGSPIYDGIGLSMDSINDPAGQGHHAMCIFITDGDEGGSYTYNEQMINNLMAEKVSIGWDFAFLPLGYGAKGQAQTIKQMIKQGGGTMYTGTSRDIGRFFQECLKRLRN